MSARAKKLPVESSGAAAKKLPRRLAVVGPPKKALRERVVVAPREVSTPDVEIEGELSTSNAQLWMRARDECERRLKRLPTNEDMVKYARSAAGRFVRHLFPFDQVEESAFKHWVTLAGYYTRHAFVVYSSDPDAAPTRVRALHFVNQNGQRGIASIDQVMHNVDFLDQVLAQAKKELSEFQRKYDSIAKIRKSPKLQMAVEYAALAMKALS